MTKIFTNDKPLFDWKDLDDSFCQHVRAFSNTNGHVKEYLDQYNSNIETENGPSHTILRPSRVSDHILLSPSSFYNQIQNAHEKEEIFDIFEAMAFRKIANRLRYLHEITIDCNPDDPAMQFASLIEMALFFSRFGKILPYPQIGICPDGTLQIEWNSPPCLCTS